MRNALSEVYGVDSTDGAAYRKFIHALMENLSMLVSGGKNPEIFEPDFDAFMTMVVRSVNSCGEMMDLLERYGIEYRPKWKNEDDEEE